MVSSQICKNHERHRANATFRQSLWSVTCLLDQTLSELMFSSIKHGYHSLDSNLGQYTKQYHEFSIQYSNTNAWTRYKPPWAWMGWEIPHAPLMTTQWKGRRTIPLPRLDESVAHTYAHTRTHLPSHVKSRISTDRLFLHSDTRLGKVELT